MIKLKSKKILSNQIQDAVNYSTNNIFYVLNVNKIHVPNVSIHFGNLLNDNERKIKFEKRISTIQRIRRIVVIGGNKRIINN